MKMATKALSRCDLGTYLGLKAMDERSWQDGYDVGYGEQPPDRSPWLHVNQEIVKSLHMGMNDTAVWWGGYAAAWVDREGRA